MTDKEAIEYLKYMQKHIGFNKIGYVYGNEAIGTVSGLIEKQQAEIRQYDKALHDQIIKDYDMELELKAEIEKKDKMIDEMANKLVGITFSDKDNLEIIFDNEEEVKEYFKKKVEEK